MAFDKTEIPEWKKDNPDAKPAQSKIDAGFVPGEKPAASMWNWFANRVGRAILDLYDNAIHKDQKGVADGIAPLDANNKIPSIHLSSTNIYGTTTGGPTAYLLAVADGPTSYFEGMEISLKINVQNTGAATIKVNALAAIQLRKSNGSLFASGNLKVNSVYSFIYNGTSFILQGEGGEYGTAIPGDVITGKTIGTETGLVNGTLALTGDSVEGNVLAGKTFYSTDPKVKRTGTMLNNDGLKMQISGYESVTELIPHPSDPNNQSLITALNAYSRNGYIGPNTQIQFSVKNLVPTNIKAGVAIGRDGGTGSQVMVGTLMPGGMSLNSSINIPTDYPKAVDSNEQYYSINPSTWNGYVYDKNMTLVQVVDRLNNVKGVSKHGYVEFVASNQGVSIYNLSHTLLAAGISAGSPQSANSIAMRPNEICFEVGSQIYVSNFDNTVIGTASPFSSSVAISVNKKDNFVIFDTYNGTVRRWISPGTTSNLVTLTYGATWASVFDLANW